MAGDSLLASCPSCGAKNRIPIERIGQSGRCGRCREALPADCFYAEAPIAVGDRRFDLLTRRSPLPVLVEFWASWCEPCYQLAPVLEQMARELSGRLLVVKVDSERAMGTATRFGVRAVPTMVILRSGLEVDRITGLVPPAALRQRLERFL